MPIDRSARTLIAALLWVAAAFMIMNNVVFTSGLDTWLLPFILIVVGAVLVFYPQRTEAVSNTQTGDVDSIDTQERSDTLASIGSPAPLELQDPVENINTDPTATLEESDEISGPPTASISHTEAVPAPAPTPASALATPEVTSEPIDETVTSEVDTQEIMEGDIESDDTQERSDAMASIGSPASIPPELQDPVENINTDPTATLEESDEISGPPTASVSHEEGIISDDKSDNLTIIEGIGPKMSAALIDAGIDSFAKVASASEDDLREALSNAGMRFSPTLTTWMEQASYAARGDWDGLQAYKKTISSRRSGS